MDSQSVFCQYCGSSEWGSNYTDTSIDPVPRPSFRALGCIEQGCEEGGSIEYYLVYCNRNTVGLEQAWKGALSVKCFYKSLSVCVKGVLWSFWPLAALRSTIFLTRSAQICLSDAGDKIYCICTVCILAISRYFADQQLVAVKQHCTSRGKEDEGC